MPVDLGDVPQVQGPANLPNIQGLIKYRYAMQAMREMKYAAVGLGEFEDARSPCTGASDDWSFNEKHAAGPRRKPPRRGEGPARARSTRASMT